MTTKTRHAIWRADMAAELARIATAEKEQIMTTKTRHAKQRADMAAELARIAMRLQRTSADKVDALIRRADTLLHNYKMSKILDGQKASGTFEKHVSDEATMQSLADVIKEVTAPLGFALLVFSQEPDDSERCNYVSNCHRDDICAAMAEFIAANEERLFSGPATKQ